MPEIIIDVQSLTKQYASGHQVLRGIDLQIQRGEIFALLGPNGAGKTSLISIICGLVNPGGGRVLVAGHDVVREAGLVRSRIGLVPQEITINLFETVWNSLVFSRGLFGKAPNPEYLEGILRALSLWEKRHQRVQALSGGMKRRVLIAKALAHEPEVLFLDEPTAGVDVELRRDMWKQIDKLRQQGVTIILTTHYIEEAEELADRIGIINRGEILLVDRKQDLMQKLGRKQLILQLKQPLAVLPEALAGFGLELDVPGQRIIHHYADNASDNQVTQVLAALHASGLELTDIQTRQHSLEQIFVDLLEDAQ